MEFSPIWWSCTFCKKAFQEKSSLVQHRKEEHRERILERRRTSQGNRSSSSDSSELEDSLLMQKEPSSPTQILTPDNYPSNSNFPGDSITFWMDSINLEMEDHDFLDNFPDPLPLEPSFPNIEEVSDYPYPELEEPSIPPTLSSTSLELLNPEPEIPVVNGKKDISKFLKIRSTHTKISSRQSCSPTQNQNPRSKFVCTNCSKSFTWKKTLISHEKQCQSMQNNSSTSKSSSLEDLLLDGEPKSDSKILDEGPIQMKTEMTSKKNQFDYVDWVTKSTSVVDCQFCSSKFLRIDQLLEHLKVCEFILSQESKDNQGNVKDSRPPVTRKVKQNPPGPSSDIVPSVDPYKFVMDSKDNSGTNFICPHCGKSFTKKGSLNSHVKTHTRPFKCTMCERQFAKSCRLRLHLEGHEQQGKNGNGGFSCGFCPKNFKYAGTLSRHQNWHVEMRMEASNAEASWMASRNGNLGGSSRLVEGRQNNFYCPPNFNWTGAGGGVLGPGMLFGETRIKCPICPWIVGSQVQLIQHFRNVHEDIFVTANMRTFGGLPFL